MNEERKIEVEEVENVATPPRARVDPPRNGDDQGLHAPGMAEGVRGTPSPDHDHAQHGGGGAPPPPAGSPDTYRRKRDYLEGFLAQQASEPEATESGGNLYEQVIDALKEIYDPEIPVNIYELGLIYNVEVSDDGDAKVVMTLTTPHCPVAESMPGEVELRVCAVPGIRTADVDLVWDPPWDPQKMSDEAKLELGML